MAYKKGLGHTTGYRKDLYSYVNHLIFFYKGEVGVYECQCRLHTLCMLLVVALTKIKSTIIFDLSMNNFGFLLLFCFFKFFYSVGGSIVCRITKLYIIITRPLTPLRIQLKLEKQNKKL